MLNLQEKDNGFSLIELLLASALFSVVVFAFFTAFAYGQEGAAVAGNRNRATLLAEEGLEAVYNIRQNDFGALSVGSYGLSNIVGRWTLTDAPDVNDIYTRKIDITDFDINKKKIVSTVTWQQNLQRNGSVSLVVYLANWTKPPTATCVVMGNFNFFNPLSPEKSGIYPASGKQADTVTVSSTNPVSEGFLILNMNFESIPENFTNTTIFMGFTDLDLHGDITSRFRLDEGFMLMDKDDNILASLNEEYNQDDNFSWEYQLPNSLLTDDSLLLKAKFTAKVTWLSGGSRTITNSGEAIGDIKICGYVED